MNLDDYLIVYFLEARMTALINNDFTGLIMKIPKKLKQCGNSCDTMMYSQRLTLKMKGSFTVTTS